MNDNDAIFRYQYLRNNYRTSLKCTYNLTTFLFVYVKLFQRSRFVVLELNFNQNGADFRSKTMIPLEADGKLA